MAPISRVVDHDLRCARCGEHLYRLALSDKCPGCGQRVQRSWYVHDWLGSHWVATRIRSGVVLWLSGNIIFALGIAWGYCFQLQPTVLERLQQITSEHRWVHPPGALAIGFFWWDYNMNEVAPAMVWTYFGMGWCFWAFGWMCLAVGTRELGMMPIILALTGMILRCHHFGIGGSHVEANWTEVIGILDPVLMIAMAWHLRRLVARSSDVWLIVLGEILWMAAMFPLLVIGMVRVLDCLGTTHTSMPIWMNGVYAVVFAMFVPMLLRMERVARFGPRVQLTRETLRAIACDVSARRIVDRVPGC